MPFPFNISSEKHFDDLTLEEILAGQIFLIDKPLTWSSFQAVNKIKHTIKTKFKVKKFKIGHAGTLDPLASGLLIICTGKSTKLIPSFQDGIKEYTGTITLGATTPSFDLETEIDQTFPLDPIPHDKLLEVRDTFMGEILQTPPVFSAVKIEGRRAYKSARKGQDIVMRRRLVEVHEFDINSDEFPLIKFRIACSKGTYIRSIASDFGKLLNNGSHLSELRRTKIGDFTVPE